MTASRKTWSEVLVEFDGHIHSPAKDCLHRENIDACRVCCPHTDDPRITEPEPDDEPERVGYRDLVAGLLGCAVIYGLIVGLIYLCVAVAS